MGRRHGNPSRWSRLRGPTFIHGLVAFVVCASAAPAAGQAQLPACLRASGVAADGFGVAIAAVSVRSSGECGSQSVYTDNVGRFSLVISARPSETQVVGTVHASKPGFADILQDIRPDLGVEYQNHIRMLFDVSVVVEPNAAHPGDVVTLRARTSAPPPWASYGSTVIADLPDGTTTALTPGTTGPDQYTPWNTTYGIPPTTADGRYTVRACAVSFEYTGSCADAPVNSLLSLVADSTFDVDTLGAVALETLPVRFATVSVVTNISVKWLDVGSGLAAGSATLAVDGVDLPASFNGSVASAPSGQLAPGIHYLTGSILDRAGNLATVSFPFTLALLSASPAVIEMSSQTVHTNPGNQLPPPSTVQFAAPTVSVGQYSIELNATTRVGWSDVSRGVDLPTLRVSFANEAGFTTVVDVPPPVSIDGQAIGTISPSVTPLLSIIKQHEVALPDVVVDVPLAFRTGGSTATLLESAGYLGPIVANESAGTMFGQAWTGTVPLVGSIDACLASAALRSSCQVDQGVNIENPVTRANILSSPQPNPIDSTADATAPACQKACDSESPIVSKHLGLTVGCPTFNPVGSSNPINLCTGLPTTVSPPATSWSGYANLFLYRTNGSAPTTTLWQQNHSSGSAVPCPNGFKTVDGVTGATYRLAANIGSLSPGIGGYATGTSQNLNFPTPGAELVYLGETTGNDHAGTTTTELPFQLSNDPALSEGAAVAPLNVRTSHYIGPNFGIRVDALGEAVPADSQTVSNRWEYGRDSYPSAATPGVAGERVQLHTGAAYRPQAGTTSYAINSHFSMTFSLSFSCQAP